MRIRRPRPPRPDAHPCVNPYAAGLDIGSEAIWACVPEDRAPPAGAAIWDLSPRPVRAGGRAGYLPD